jgi:hypothetical protein
VIDISRPTFEHSSSDRRKKSRRSDDRRVADRRSEPRHRATAVIRYMRSGAPPERVLPGELYDVSRGGLRILIDEPIMCPESLLIEIRDAGKCCCNLTARLIWCQPFDDNRFQAGCELSVELSKAQFGVLKSLSPKHQS